MTKCKYVPFRFGLMVVLTESPYSSLYVGQRCGIQKKGSGFLAVCVEAGVWS